MHELEQVLIGDSAASPPAVILESLDDSLADRIVRGAPRSIYEELWHITYWQQITLEWVEGIETPYPVHRLRRFPERGRKSPRRLGHAASKILPWQPAGGRHCA